jgi:hypothetical protein
MGLPLAVYGSELDTALARPAGEPLADLPLRVARFAANEEPIPVPRHASATAGRPASTVMTPHAREPAVGAIVAMAAALIGSIAVGSALVRPRRSPSPIPPPTRIAPRDVASPRATRASARSAVPSGRVRPAAERATSDEGREPDEDTLVLRAQLSRAEESRDRLAERVGRLRARTNVSVIANVDRYQRLQDELETAREDLDRAETEVARWRRALRRVG